MSTSSPVTVCMNCGGLRKNTKRTKFSIFHCFDYSRNCGWNCSIGSLNKWDQLRHSFAITHYGGKPLHCSLHGDCGQLVKFCLQCVQGTKLQMEASSAACKQIWMIWPLLHQKFYYLWWPFGSFCWVLWFFGGWQATLFGDCLHFSFTSLSLELLVQITSVF